jgi:hypothetical protein
MVYEKVQKDSSSWNPAFQHQKSESLFRSRPFSIPAEADTDSAQEQEIPTYSRADRDAISAKLLKSMDGNVQTQAETQSQKPKLEQSPAFDHHKSESFFQPRPFSIQPQADTDSAQEQEIPAYSRAERDAISAKLFKPMGENVQSQAETPSQKPKSEQSPAFDHHKSESFFQPRPFSIQPQADTDSAQEQEIPIYSRAERDAISAKLFKPRDGNVQTQAETASQKPDYEQSPAFDHHKSESFFRPRPFSIQPQADTDSAQEQEIPAYSRAERDAISAKLFKPRDGNVQGQTETLSQKPDYESEGLESDKVSAEAETLQRQEESPESGDDDENSPNGGAIQRQPDSSDNNEDEELSPETGAIQRQPDSSDNKEEEELSPETGAIQRQPDSSDNEDDQMKSVQTKLNIGAPGDKYEQEADQMADRVMSMNALANPQSVQRVSEGEEEVQRSPLAASITPLIQRFSEEEFQTKPSVQKAGESGASQAGASLESRLSSQKGGGTPLDDEVKSFMEPRFGTDFSGVRIHTGGDAVSMNKELHAQAFAHGSDIYFNEGKYNPGSNEGKQLLAHELTHVVQQTGVKKLQQKPLTSLQSNKETLQTKISPTLGAAIQLKKAPASPQADPAFQAVVNKTKGVAKQQKAHPPAKAKSSEAQAAAKPPANEVESKAQDKKVQEMNQQQAGKFNAAAFKAALMQKIAAITPNTLEEADKFKENNKIGSVKSEVSSKVTDEKKQASDPIENKTKEQPNTSGITPKAVTPLPPKQAGSKPGDVGATGATPKPKDASEVSLQEGSKSLDQEMASANVTEEQLKKSNEPEFQGAVAAKKTAQTDAAKAPQEYRQQEQGIVTQAQAQAKTTAVTELQGMHGSKEQVLAKVLGNQSEAKGQDEQKRTEVANHIQGIYNNTKQKVETSLSQLDGEVNKDFDAGAATAQKLFEDYVGQRMKRYKDERYSGLGAARWVTDKLFGMPSEVNAFYQEGKKQYLASMDKTIDKIANLVSTKLSAAKQEITKGRQEIQKYVAGLDPSLRQVGQEAAQNIQSQFDELETSVDNKQNELIDSLAQKYNDNLQQLNARLDEMKAANRGLVDKAKEAMGGVIKTILELKNMLMGVLAKSAGAIDKIILDPIAFLGNLISGIKQGFNKFAGNIDKHLKKGLLGWLTGALAGAGVTMPESFDLKGIFSLVMQVLGVVYEGIKSRCIKALGKNGEKMFTALESSFEMFVILKNEGIGGLWQFLQDKIGDLKVMVIDTIQTFVIENVIKAGVLWVVSLLNPASAFVKACKAIYDIIMFFIERGSQIAQLVNAVTDSVGAIASGAVGGAAALIENALGTSLPVVISFMASLLGLGGISEKVGGIIKTVRQPIDKAIDWLIAQAVKAAKKIGNKLGFGKDKGNKEGKESQEGAIPDFQVQEPFSMSGEGHKLTAKVNKGHFEIIIASNPQEFEFALTNAIDEVNASNRSEEDKKYYLTVLRQVLKAVKEIKFDMENNKGKILKGVKLDPESEKQALEQYIKSRQAEMANQIQSFAATAKIKSLDDFYKAPPSERYIPGYPDQTTVGKFIRNKLYNPLGWDNIRSQVKSQEKTGLIQKVKAVQKSGDQGAWQDLISTGLVEPNASIDSYDPDKVDYHVDHIEPLAKRWNQQGHNSNDSRRLHELGERTNLRLVTAIYNTSKGSGGINYLPYVGPNFTSQFAEGGINGSLKVYGQPFLDASGKPLV